MEFTTDKQTLNDLNILGQYKLNSILSLFNDTITEGGKRLLEGMFRDPLVDHESINTRKDIISFFHKLDISLPFKSDDFELMENYLMNAESKNRVIAAINITQTKLLNLIAHEKEYEQLKEGLTLTIKMFYKLKEVVEKIEINSHGNPYHEKAVKILELLNHKLFIQAYKYIDKPSLRFRDVLKLDYIFRALLLNDIDALLKDIYELDVYVTVSSIAREKGFIYATALEKEECIIDIKDVYHPFVPNAIANDVHIEDKQNVFFLTGANMAGKSTFMKSFAVALYLAHMGFPVAAKSMIFSVHDGMYTSINVPDDITKGYSHFYAEVLRVKKVAEEVASNKHLVIIFDELFKGTNVKDAYDGTVAITDSLSKRKGTFIISTHIMEAGENLRDSNKKIFFKFLPTVMNGSIPTYTYKLKDGITDDRQGMIIIRNEKILETINNKKEIQI